MKSVLRSVKPFWFYLICEGIKKAEIGKSEPKSEDFDGVVYLYCTKDMKSFRRIPEAFQKKYKKYLGTVGARFICNQIESFTTDYRRDDEQNARIEMLSRVSFSELCEYEHNAHCLCAWHISQLTVYEEPKRLSSFLNPCKEYDNPSPRCGDCEYYHSESNDCVGFYEECRCDGLKLIKRPPQSWCYVKEQEG